MIDWFDGPGIGEEIDRLMDRLEKEAVNYYSGDERFDSGFSAGLIHAVEELYEVLYGSS